MLARRRLTRQFDSTGPSATCGDAAPHVTPISIFLVAIMMHDLRALREREFSRLEKAGHTYLDYTGSGLYAESQVRAHAELLCGAVLGNPHSRNPASSASTERVEEARERVAGFFDADPADYEIVFTGNASGALKLVAESFPFTARSRLLLTADNHNSAHGMREYATAKGATVRYVPLDAELRVPDIEPALEAADRAAANLFVFPAQSNFSGVKHPLGWVRTAQEAGYRVMLDAAALVPTSPLSFREVRPDFACLSFYKMFGFPTGVGALFLRKDALPELHRPWFAGGTVRFVSAGSGVQLLHDTARAFEDGTVNYLDIAAIPAGLEFLNQVGIEQVNSHVMELTESLLERLHELRHSDGSRMVRVYGPSGTDGRGGTVALNLVDSSGALIDFREVERRANEATISIRTGFFCNPGAAEFAFDYPNEQVGRCGRSFTASTFTIQEFSTCMGDKPVGAVRVSLGIASDERDILRLIEVLASFRDEGSSE